MGTQGWDEYHIHQTKRLVRRIEEKEGRVEREEK